MRIEDKMIDNDMWGNVPHPPRTDNKYDDDKKAKSITKESVDDPFADILVDEEQGNRLHLVREVCENKVSVEELVDKFLA